MRIDGLASARNDPKLATKTTTQILIRRGCYTQASTCAQRRDFFGFFSSSENSGSGSLFPFNGEPDDVVWCSRKSLRNVCTCSIRVYTIVYYSMLMLMLAAAYAVCSYSTS